MVEGVDSMKLANKLNNACLSANKESLNVFVQINTSNEASKSGCEPDDAVLLAEHIIHNCPYLKLQGLMTIGKYGDTSPKYFQVIHLDI